MTIWFDVEDLVHYFRVGNKRISGIQRVSFEIFQAAMSLVDKDVAIGFVRHGTKPLTLIPVAWEDLLADFGDAESPTPLQPEPPPPELEPAVPASLPQPRERKPSLSRRLARTTVDRLPTEIRRPLVLAGVMQLQVAAALARFGVQTAVYPIRRGTVIARAVMARTRRAPPSAALNQPAPGIFDRLAQPGDTLLVLGAPWNRERYSDLARHLRDERRMYFGVLVHDLVPIRHPEWCHRGVPRMFREWYTDVLPFCDVVFANSRHTAADVEAYARETGLALNGRVRTLPIGSGFGSAAEPPTPAASGNYVLFVSTMEARKNHALLVRVWSMLLDEVDAGLRTAASVPDLVFAGRIGWLVADLLAQLDHTDWLGRRIRLVANPSDVELRALYAGCLFTVFPSWHEGWGLPVTESLALGKPCIASNAASLPEAGGALCRYFDPGSVQSARTAIAAALDDPADLEAWSARIRREWHPTPWTQTARTLFAHIAALDGPA